MSHRTSAAYLTGEAGGQQSLLGGPLLASACMPVQSTCFRATLGAAQETFTIQVRSKLQSLAAKGGGRASISAFNRKQYWLSGGPKRK